MKKFKIFIWFIFCFLLTKNVYAAAPTASISASSSSVTSGQNVTAYVTVNNFTTAQIEVQSAGATTGCSYNDIIQSDTGENITKTISVTCKSSGQGVISFTYKVTALNKNYEQANLSGQKVVSVTKPREKDTNNYLQSIGVTGYTLTPEFNQDTMEYSVEVPNTVDKVTLEAVAASGYATVSGTGEVEVNEGANTFEIKVLSETGSERIYKITVNVIDENPIELQINNTSYTVVKNAKNVEVPSTFEATTVTIDEMEIPAFYSETLELTLISVKDNKGDIFYVIYEEGSDAYQLYNENKSDQLLLYILPISEEKEGFGKVKVTIDEQSYDALKADNADVYLVYATNILTGKNAYYVYDQTNNSYTLYDDSLLSSYIEQQEQYKMVILGMGGALIVGILIIAILLLRKPKQKKIKEKTSEKAQEEVIKKKPETKIHSKEEALEKVNDVTQIIEDYEKTVQLDKKEIAKKLQEEEEKSSEDSKKNTKKTSKKKKNK